MLLLYFQEIKRNTILTKKTLILELYKDVNSKEIKDEVDSNQISEIIHDVAKTLCDNENTNEIFTNIFTILIAEYKDTNINLFDFRLSEIHGSIELHAFSNKNHKFHEELLELEDYEDIYNFINSIECDTEAMEDEGTKKFVHEISIFIYELTCDYIKKVIPKYFTKESLSKLNINYPLSFYFNEEEDEDEAWEGTLLHTLEI